MLQITTDENAWLDIYKPQIARPDMYNQQAKRVNALHAGVFNYIITNQTDDIVLPSVTCKNWLENQTDSTGKALICKVNAPTT